MVSKRTDDRFVGGGSCFSDACFVALVEQHEGAELAELGRANVDRQVVGLVFTVSVSDVETEGLSSWISGDIFV